MTRETRGQLWASAYHSYLVRLWQGNEQGAWRASAQCVQSGHTLLFPDIDQLLAFLQRQISLHADPNAAPAHTSRRADALSGADDGQRAN